VLEYFQGIGYHCPATVDLADFLQVLPTSEGKYYAVGNDVPIGTIALVQAYRTSDLYKNMQEEMIVTEKKMENFEWPDFVREAYAVSVWQAILLCLDRQVKLTVRDLTFLKGRVIQTIMVGSITGSLFNNLEPTDTTSMNGMLFFSVLFVALSSMSMLPLIFAQREVFYKHSRANFFPTIAFTIAQTSVLIPLQIVESIVFSTIVYWSVGMTDAENGARFLTFVVIVLGFGLTMTQLFRLIASFMPSAVVAQPFAGTVTVLMVLFSGYIVPKSGIPPGWTWFYWLNPLSWALKSVTVNEYLADDYDFQICTNMQCTTQGRFGDIVLDSRGNPTEQGWVWYGIAFVYASFVIFVLLTSLALSYVRVEASPPPPIKVEPEGVDENVPPDALSPKNATITANDVQIPYDPVTFSFKNLWYTVKLQGGEELDLLRGVSGFFEPGTLTALMGSSGAVSTQLINDISIISLI
jgi:ABC-type multidrug transport system fused ATPase/permease subunit